MAFDKQLGKCRRPWCHPAPLPYSPPSPFVPPVPRGAPSDPHVACCRHSGEALGWGGGEGHGPDDVDADAGHGRCREHCPGHCRGRCRGRCCYHPPETFLTTFSPSSAVTAPTPLLLLRLPCLPRHCPHFLHRTRLSPGLTETRNSTSMTAKGVQGAPTGRCHQGPLLPPHPDYYHFLAHRRRRRHDHHRHQHQHHWHHCHCRRAEEGGRPCSLCSKRGASAGFGPSFGGSTTPEVRGGEAGERRARRPPPARPLVASTSQSCSQAQRRNLSQGTLEPAPAPVPGGQQRTPGRQMRRLTRA